MLAGKAEVEPQRSRRESELVSASGRFVPPPGTLPEAWQRLDVERAALTRDVASRRIGAADSFARHTTLIAGQIELHDRLVEQVGLGFESDPATHFLVVGTLRQMPRLTELMGQLRARGSVAPGQGASITAADRARIASLADRLREQAR